MVLPQKANGCPRVSIPDILKRYIYINIIHFQLTPDGEAGLSGPWQWHAAMEWPPEAEIATLETDVEGNVLVMPWKMCSRQESVVPSVVSFSRPKKISFDNFKIRPKLFALIWLIIMQLRCRRKNVKCNVFIVSTNQKRLAGEIGQATSAPTHVDQAASWWLVHVW